MASNHSDGGNSGNKSSSSFYKDNQSIIWIVILFMALFVFNYILFQLYVASHPQQNLADQLWDFLESDGFKVVTISLLLPIFLFLFEIIFKVRERIDERRKKIEEDKAEILKKEIWDVKEKQLETITQTQKVFSDLIGISSELRYYDANCGTRIEDIRIKLDKFVISAEEMVNMWYFRFNSAEKYCFYYEDLLITPLDVLTQAASTVAKYIHDHPDKKEEIRSLQFALAIIENSVKCVAHHPLMNVLNSIMVYEYHDKDETIKDGIDTKRQEDAEKKIKKNLATLDPWVRSVQQFTNQNNKIVAYLKEDKNLDPKYYNKLQKICEELEEFWRNNPLKPRESFEKFDELEKLYYDLPPARRTYSVELPYSYNFMMQLAEELDFDHLCEDIKDRAEWPKQRK